MPSMGPIPKPTEDSLAWFGSLVPDAPGVTVRPMFGNKAAFVNGNMFLALFGPSVAVRLSTEDQAELMKQKGSAVFEPMPGRAMKEYVVLPDAWRKQPAKAKSWVDRSLAFVAALPPKKK
jgi:TfoX/Sxy family transcriptional regulator of competence genes